jgi:hypothetical protein
MKDIIAKGRYHAGQCPFDTHEHRYLCSGRIIMGEYGSPDHRRSASRRKSIVKSIPWIKRKRAGQASLSPFHKTGLMALYSKLPVLIAEVRIKGKAEIGKYFPARAMLQSHPCRSRQGIRSNISALREKNFLADPRRILLD